MTTQRKFTLIWLLLPLLVLRGLVPAGFMIDSSSDGLSMVICSGGVYKTVTLDKRGDHGDHAPTTEHASEHDQQTHGDSICPFAAAATGAPAPTTTPLVAVVFDIDTVVNDIAEFHSPFGPSRTQQSRAPPFFS